MNGKDIIRRLLSEGWAYSHTRGSHHYYKKEGHLLVVPVHGAKDLSKGTLRSIEKQAGWKP
jgi:predicted RNA binding protein YcfA (HicA-like mRNA interferase family)